MKYYRVRKSWDDAKSQLGVYTVLANVKAMTDKHPGDEVYDWNGKQVYPEAAECVAGEMSNLDCLAEHGLFQVMQNHQKTVE